MSVGHGIVQALVARAASAQAGEGGCGVALIEHHHVFQRHAGELVGEEEVACLGDVRALLFTGDQRLFFSDSFIRRSVFHRAPVLMRRPSSSAMRVLSSSSVASGFSLTKRSRC